MRIHVIGASGSGTTTLGAALAARLDLMHVDSDDIYWLPTDPPYRTPRASNERAALFFERTRDAPGWVFTGSALRWGGPIEPFYDLVVFLKIDPELRKARLLRREAERYGARVEPGGDMAEKTQQFLEWAASYDTAGLGQRSLVSHEAWLATLKCPVLRLDSARAVDALVAEVLAHPAMTDATTPRAFAARSAR